MEGLTKTQLILLALLVSFVTSLVTGIVTVTLVNQAPPAMTQAIYKVIEKATVGGNASKESAEKISVITQEDLVIKLVRESSAAVVSVIATKDLPVVEKYFINPFQNDEFFRQMVPPEMLPQFQVPQYRQNGTAEKQISSGTGFFVSADGMIVTNKHVVEDTEAAYSILFNDGRKLSAKVLARDPLQDIAVLKVDQAEGSGMAGGKGYTFIPLGASDNLSVGQTVVAIGNVLGEFQNTVSTGVISGLRRSLVANGSAAGPEVLQELIQTDAAINPGNSGGPLLDLSGRVIGINTAMAQGAQSVGFALPINIAKKDIGDIKEFGRIRYAFFGVRYLMINEKVKEDKKLSVDYGVLITNGDKGEPAVMSDSPAAKAGFKAGDIILEFGGVKIDQNNTLAKLISQRKVGDKVKIKFISADKESVVEVELAERPDKI
ncbi:MAG: trypsin-like peptidase domain-containing protein [Candidatus Niyogibacteria bacterium]|nr:trypsin-like peptidase domain-containing protein [Candidatus Niyogibacteria bacterium]